MTEQTLKPCEHCGKNVAITTGYGDITFFVCECGAITSFKNFRNIPFSREESIAAWNKRVGEMTEAKAREIVENLKENYYIEDHREAWNIEGWFNAEQLEAIARVMREQT